MPAPNLRGCWVNRGNINRPNWLPGYFHCWGQDNTCDEHGGAAHYPCAIVEDNTGAIFVVPATSVNFGPVAPKDRT